MSATTAIEWTDATWNPVTGCTKVSAGCDHCYAETFAERWRGVDGHYFEHGFDVQLRPDKLALPLRWRRPRRVFVNSMSDLFHSDVPDDYVLDVWKVMARTPQHTYQILTKRHGRMRSFVRRLAFATATREERAAGITGRVPYLFADGDENQRVGPVRPLANVWLGVSAENQQWANLRVPALLDTPAAVRFLSCEPLLGAVDLGALDTREGPIDALAGNFDHVREPDGTLSTLNNPRPLPGLDWVIAGGESGPGARPMHPGWARALRDQCAFASVPFLFKQKGAWTWETHLGDPNGVGRSPWADREPDAYVNEHNGHVADEAAALAAGGSWTGMHRVGKKRAGRELDGRTWDQCPPTTTETV